MRRPATLRNRLALAAVVSTAAWVTVLTVAFNVVLASRLRGQAVSFAKNRAQAVASTLDVVNGAVLERESRNDSGLDAGVWIFADHRSLERPRASAELQRTVEEVVGNGVHSFRPAIEGRVQLYALPVMADRRQVGTVVAVVSMQPYERGLQLALLGSIGVALAVLVGVYAGARVIVARALRPVEAMTRQAAQWSAGDVDNRFALASRHAELAALGVTLDGMLDRISATLRHEQQLSGELSHELRTPLTHILAEVELLAGEDPEPEVAAAYARVTRSADRMQTILTTLLQAARAQSGSAPGRCDLASAVRACVADWPDGEPRVVLHASGPVSAGAPTEIVERIVQPLLDNALRYAETCVDVTVTASADAVLVVVADDGPGLPTEWLETAFEAGFTTGDGHEGAGLGLALSRRLARAAGGDVVAEPCPTGARFVVTLPGG